MKKNILFALSLIVLMAVNITITSSTNESSQIDFTLEADNANAGDLILFCVIPSGNWIITPGAGGLQCFFNGGDCYVFQDVIAVNPGFGICGSL
jgi:hypothetical protein